MTLDYLGNHHYPQFHQNIGSCRRLAQQIYELIRFDSCQTTELRRTSMAQFGCTKSQFDAALKKLQIP